MDTKPITQEQLTFALRQLHRELLNADMKEAAKEFEKVLDRPGAIARLSTILRETARRPESTTQEPAE